MQVSAARVETVFPLAVHLEGYIRCGDIQDLTKSDFPNVFGRGPKCDRRGKTFTKHFKLTLTVVVLTSDLYLLSHVRRFRISQIVDAAP